MIQRTLTLLIFALMLGVVLAGCTGPKQYDKANVDFSSMPKETEMVESDKDKPDSPESPSDTLDVPPMEDVVIREEPEKTEEDRMEEQLATILEDGEYTEEIEYMQPENLNTVSLEFTVDDGVITQMQAVGLNTERTSDGWIKSFNERIGDYVVGKAIEEVELPAIVGGASLTTPAVAKKLEEIKAN